MAEPPAPASSRSIQAYLGNKDFLKASVRSPITLANFFRDGKLIFAAQDADAGDAGLPLEEGLAKSYQRLFEESPELIEAMDRVFRTGQPTAETVRIRGIPWDARLFPTGRENRLQGVVGIFVDARDRITAFRAVSAIELLSQIRHYLARSDSPEEFLSRCCDAIGELHPAVWIGLADRGEQKQLHVIAGSEPASQRFSSLNLSWDVGRKGGRHPAAEAVTKSRVQVVKDIGTCADSDMWFEASQPWKSLMAVPLLEKGASLGVLVVHGDDPSDFDAQMVGLWERVASEIAEGIELLRTREERARITQERQDAYQQYRQLLDAIFDIVLVHRAGRVIEINPAGVRLLGGVTSDDLVGMQVVALIDPADRDRMKDTLRESGGADDLREFRVLSLDGKRIDVEGVTVSVSYDGKPARLSYWRDISRIVQRIDSLECAQHVTQSGSIDLDVSTGHAEWSIGASTILGLGTESESRPLAEALSSVVVDQDRDEVIGIFKNISEQSKEFTCEVTLKTDDQAAARTIRLHGIPKVEKHTRTPRFIIVVQDVSQYRSIERNLTAKLSAIRKLAKVVEWTYEIEQKRIVWDGDLQDFLGVKSPVPYLTYDHFMATIRAEDRELVRKAVEHSLKHGVDGEMVYEEIFTEGLKLLLFGRWRPERDASGQIVSLKGLSLDISSIRTAHDKESRKERIQLESGLPERAMMCDFVHHFTSRAKKFNEPFSIIGVRIHRYPEIKRHMANDALYHRTHAKIAAAVTSTIGGARIYGRLGKGSFAAILSRKADQEDIEALGHLLVEHWQSALKECEPCVLDAVTFDTTVIHCPADGIEMEGLLALLDKNLAE